MCLLHLFAGIIVGKKTKKYELENFNLMFHRYNLLISKPFFIPIGKI